MTPVGALLVLLLTPLVPFALAVALLLVRRSRAFEAAAAAAALPGLATSLLMPPGIAATLPWLLQGSEFGLDDEGRAFLFFSAALWLAAGLYAFRSIAASGRKRFFVFFLLAMSGNLGLIVARDMLSFYLFFMLMSLAAYGLVVHDRSAESRRAGRIYIWLAVAGDMVLFAALALAAIDTGGILLFGSVRESIVASGETDALLALLVLGFGVKAGLVGLHVALPLVYRAAPAPAAAVFAGAMLHAGLLGWLRFLPLGGDGGIWGSVLIAAGTVAVVYAAVVGTLQREAASVLAYSSVSQMGIMTAAIGAAFEAPHHSADIVAAVTLYAMHHAFAKGALFLGVGIAAAAPAGGWRGPRRLLAFALLWPALALTGAPLTSGMLAKGTLKEALASATDAFTASFAAFVPWAALATTLIVARFLWLAWPRRPGTEAAGDAGAGIGILPIAAWLAVLALSAAAVWLWPFDGSPRRWNVAVLAELSWPVVAGALVAVAVARIAAAGRLPAPAVPAGDVVVVYERIAARLGAAWGSLARGVLPEARDRLLDAARGIGRRALRARRVENAEGLLGEWNVSLTLFVALLVALAAAMIWI